MHPVDGAEPTAVAGGRLPHTPDARGGTPRVPMFRGTGGIELARGMGVMEHHRAVW